MHTLAAFQLSGDKQTVVVLGTENSREQVQQIGGGEGELRLWSCTQVWQICKLLASTFTHTLGSDAQEPQP